MSEDNEDGIDGREEQKTEEQSANDTQEWAEQNFEAVKNKMKQITQEMRNNKPQENINVRKVDAEDVGKDDDQVIVEYSVQRWYSINYFKKMLEDDNPNQDEDTIF